MSIPDIKQIMIGRISPCSVDGCTGNSHYTARGSRGFCGPHYERLRRHGDPLGGGTSLGEPMRFVREVALHHEGADCLIWPYSRNRDGYGSLRVNGKSACAHRYVCEIAHGAPPTPEHQAAHECGGGNLGCVSPRHLSWKTRQENKADELIHGTRNRGSRNGLSKLTAEQAREIIALRGQSSPRRLAVRFGVSEGTIRAAQAGKSWAWVNANSEGEAA